jgi:RimJ/RimL family protein N-acetyltransferase
VGDEDMLRFCEWYAMDEKEVEQWLVQEEKDAPFLHHHLNLALDLVEQSKVIGFVRLEFLDDDNPETSGTEMSLYVYVNREYQRRGFATEAVRGAMEFLFLRLNVRRLRAWCHCKDLACIRVLEKAGLRREGTFLTSNFVKGEWVDIAAYALLKEEYVSMA